MVCSYVLSLVFNELYGLCAVLGQGCHLFLILYTIYCILYAVSGYINEENKILW
jgi:hypothetical protein